MGIFSFLRSTQKLEHIGIIRKLGVNNIIITMVMLLFSCFGAIFGMSEETLAFVIIIVPLAISMGYDSLTGVCMVYVAAHVGFATPSRSVLHKDYQTYRYSPGLNTGFSAGPSST